MTHAMTTTAPDPTDDNHMDSVRRMLIDQMRALRNASTPEALQQESTRAKSVALVAQAVTAVSRLEVDYANTTGSSATVPFLEPQGNGAAANPAITHSPGRMVHRLRG